MHDVGSKLSAVKTSAVTKPAKSGAAAEKTSRNATLQARVRHISPPILRLCA